MPSGKRLAIPDMAEGINSRELSTTMNPFHQDSGSCRLTIQSLAIGFLILCTTVSVAEEMDTREPSKTPEAAFQRFVDECVSITPGQGAFPVKFTVGQPEPLTHELPSRSAALAYKFKICRYETTQELYLAVTGENPSRWQGPRNSVETVSWNDATRFCRRLTVLLRTKELIRNDEEVRLPTQVEWEYCCRAGTSTRYSFGDTPTNDTDNDILNDHAWSTHNAAGNDPAVGVLKPNKWGLYDVHGYLWEFVSDSAAPTGNQQPDSSLKTICGGSWRDEAALLSCSSHFPIPDHASSDAIGFRCVIATVPSSKISSDR